MQTDPSAGVSRCGRALRAARPRWLAAALLASCIAFGCGGESDSAAQPGTDESPSDEETGSVSDAGDAGTRPRPRDAGAVDARASTPADVEEAGAPDGGAVLGSDASVDAGGTDAGDASADAGDAGAEAADDACGADAQLVTGMTRKQGSGDTDWQTYGDVEILSVRTVLTVPAEPLPTRGTLFVWPGLQPLRSDSTTGYGVLQPVLAWGPSCAPGTLSTYDSWWISGQYVGSPPGAFSLRCEGGDVMKVEVGDELDIELTLEGTIWNQVVTNKSNGKSVSFKRDMKGQKQQWLINEIELTGPTKPVDDVIFTSMVVKLSDSQPKACVPNLSGSNDYFSPPRASRDGKTCCISKLILRASGIKPTSPNTP